MQIRSISISGYRGISHDEPLILEHLGRVNVFIGPNNAGKSTALRFVCAVASLWPGQPATSTGGRGKPNPRMEITLPIADENWWWSHDCDRPIQGELTFALSTESDRSLAGTLDQRLKNREPNAQGLLVYDDLWKVSVFLQKDGETNTLRGTVCAMVYLEETWKPLVQVTPTGFGHLNIDGIPVNYSDEACPYHALGAELLTAWGETCIFFDAVRAMDRGQGVRARRDLSEDGGVLLVSLLELQEDDKRTGSYRRLIERVRSNFNHLLSPMGVDSLEDLRVRPASNRDSTDTAPNRELFARFKRTRAEIPLSATGAGTAQLLLLLLKLALKTDSASSLFLEEPEAHLHPALVRRLIRWLTSLEDTQLFISTHSSAILDEVSSEDRIYRFFQATDGSIHVDPCADIGRLHDALDALGVAGSSLLQANCVIWVEGPSDRILLRYWLDLLRRQRKAELIVEGTDYTFAFYGGRVLSHHAFDHDDKGMLTDPDLSERDRLGLLYINRFSAVVMDRDRPKGDEQILATKSRIRQEAEQDPRHRKAIVTDSREVENDVDPPELLVEAIAELLASEIQRDALQGIILDGEEPFEKQVIKHLGHDPESAEARRIRRKIERKVALAHVLVRRMQEREADVSVPSYVNELNELIERSRAIEEVNN